VHLLQEKINSMKVILSTNPQAIYPKIGDIFRYKDKEYLKIANDNDNTNVFDLTDNCIARFDFTCKPSEYHTIQGAFIEGAKEE
jgi:hypothetical protein